MLGALMEEMEDGMSRGEAIAATMTVLGDLVAAVEPDKTRESIVADIRLNIEALVAHRRLLMMNDIADEIGPTVGSA